MSAQLPPPTASGNRLAVIASHLSCPPLGSPAAMSEEKEAALAAEPTGTPTMYAVETTHAGARAQPPVLNSHQELSCHKTLAQYSWAMFGYLTSSSKTIPHTMTSGGISY